MKKYLLKLCVMTLFIVLFLTGCGTNKVADLQAKIDALGENPKIVDIIDLKDEYDELSVDEQAEISSPIDMTKLSGIDANAIDKLNENIASITDSTAFSDIIEMKETYDAMSSNEQALVRDYSSVESKFELTDLEKASVSAAQYIQKVLKDSSSLKLLSVKAINDLEGDSKYYLVNINFSAENSFGATSEDTIFQTINDEFENPWYALGLLSGGGVKAIDCSPFLEFYLLNDQEPTEFDADKIMYFIDKVDL